MPAHVALIGFLFDIHKLLLQYHFYEDKLFRKGKGGVSTKKCIEYDIIETGY